MATYEVITNTTSFPGYENGTSRDTMSLVYMKIIFATAGMILNIVTLIIIAFIYQHVRQYILHIISLTVSDLIMATEMVLYALVNNIGGEKTTVLYCLQFLIKCFESASILACLCMLLVIAVDQCVAVTLPLRYKQICTIKVTKYVIAFVWIFTVVVVLAGIIVSTIAEGGTSGEKNPNTCFNFQRHYTVYVNAVLVNLSCPVFLGLYIVIYINIRALYRRDSQRGRSVSMKKATITTLILVIPFILIYVPVSIYILVISLCDIEVAWPFWEIFMVVVAAHTVCDPVIYAIRVKEIQSCYKRLCFKS